MALKKLQKKYGLIQTVDRNPRIMHDVPGDMHLSTQNIQISDLTRQLDAMQLKYETLESTKNAQIASQHDQLEDLCARLETIDKTKPEVENKNQDNRDAYIVELETKLEWALVQQDTAAQYSQHIKELEVNINDLEMHIQSILQIKKLGTMKRNPSDVRRITDLEKKITNLNQIIARKQATVASIMNTERPIIDDVDYLRHLKYRIITLEAAASESNRYYAEYKHQVLSI